MNRTTLFSFLVFGLLLPFLFSTQPSSQDPGSALRSYFDRQWQWQLRQFPERATHLGVNRYNDRLTDFSAAALETRKEHARAALKELDRFKREDLSPEDRLNYDLFQRQLKLQIEGFAFPSELAPIGPVGGIQLSFPDLPAQTPFRNSADYQMYLARLKAFPRQVDQIIALMRRGLQQKWTPPAVVLQKIPAQLRTHADEDPLKSQCFEPFRRFPSSLSEAQKRRLRESGQEVIKNLVQPAFKKLEEFFVHSYLPGCRKEIGASSLPHGAAYYRHEVRRFTTTNLSPSEIHEIGLREVRRIRTEMEHVISETGFEGSFREFLHFLRTDPRFYYREADELVRGYRDICKRIDGQLPRLFGKLPRNPYGVKVIPAAEAPTMYTAYYQPGAADGSRAGFYMVNTYKLDTRPRYEMEALTLHESVPGHHLQISLAQELKSLPDFRRNAGFTAFVEGWALYAESLGSELGLYRDPYSRFGQLTYEMWRAARLVVDTGIHSMGWSRQRAVEFMLENTAKTGNDINVEVDRYISWPGQALAYEIGALKIRELRSLAQKRLGRRFDIRRFHDALLSQGALPLDVLDSRIRQWIDHEQSRPSD